MNCATKTGGRLTCMSYSIKGFILLCFVCASVQGTFAQTPDANITLESVSECFQLLKQQNRFVDNLSDIVSSGQSAHNLPIGFKRTIGNIPITLAVTRVKFNNQYGEITLLMEMEVPQKSTRLMFAATGIKISYQGDLIGDIKLSLLNDVPISLGNLGDWVLKGKYDIKSGTIDSNTFVSLDCNGNFNELSLDTDVILNKNTFKLAGSTDEPVRSSFRVVINDWNDLMVELSFPTLEIKGMAGFEFTLSQATLDLSDLKNPGNFDPNPEYFNNYFTLPNRLLWRGLYVENFSVAFPGWFKKSGSQEKISIEAHKLLIDEIGITGDILGNNIIPLESGNIGGWPFSITDFRLTLLANNITGFGFGGQINFPLSPTNRLQTYKAYISKNEYLFSANLGDTLDFNLFGPAKLHLDPTSYLEIVLKDKQFKPRLVLNGSMGIDQDGLKMEQIAFRKLAIATESPVLSVETVEYGGQVGLNNFPITISDIKFTAANDLASLGFDLKINFMDGKIAADSKLQLTSEYKDKKWKYKSLVIDKIRLENVEMAGFSLDGEIRMEKDHPKYGNYFGGEIHATFGALSNALKVDVTSVFGNKGYRYWYVEGAATFATGIPIGPLSLNGFTGGAYYKMAATGGTGLDAYAPNNNCSLGLKAGVSYSIGSEKAAKGDALFEINFLSDGGVKNIRFYGTAEFMPATKLTNELNRLDKLYKEAQKEVKDMSQSLVANLAASLSGTEISKKLLPDIQLTTGVNAYLTMSYDFPSKTFDAGFQVMVNTPGGFLQGTGANKEAGWANLHFSPQKWYVHIGKPSNPVGLKLGLGPLSLSTTSYFMLGDELENPLPPPTKTLEILKITPKTAEFLSKTGDMKTGKGIGFGSRFDFDTGDLKFLLLYAHFAAETGFDFMLTSDCACEDTPTVPAGINGWYAQGQAYTYLYGALGVKIKLLFINKKIEIISGAAAAALTAKGPNPTWVGGAMALNLNVLNGLIKANMNMKFSFGKDCKIVPLGGESPINLPLIADLSPANGSKDIDVFLIPQATFNMAVGEEFRVEDENGTSKRYRIKLTDFYVTDNNNQRMEGSYQLVQNQTAANLETKEVLPPHTKMNAFVSVGLEEYSNGKWSDALYNGKKVSESKTVSFETGEAPNYIPKNNIEYIYPVIDQKNFFANESNSGYIKLKRGQTYLFPAGFTYQAAFTPAGGQAVNVSYSYKSGEQVVEYTIPSLVKDKNYAVDFTVISHTPQSSSANNKKVDTQQLTDDSGETVHIDIEQQMAQQLAKDATVSILDYKFKSGKYGTLSEKLSAFSFTPAQIYENEDTRSFYLTTGSTYELFDPTELTGTGYTGNQPLIQVKATLTDTYYTADIGPMLYHWYPLAGITIAQRDANQYGVPPAKAILFYDNYLSTVESNTYNAGISKTFPYVYRLPYYYYKDYRELYDKAVNYKYRYPGETQNIRMLQPLLSQEHFLFPRQGNYPVSFDYILPGNKKGATQGKVINFVNTLNWR